MLREFLTLRCKDNVFKYNTICFAGQFDFYSSFWTEKGIIRGFLPQNQKKKEIISALKTFFYVLLHNDNKIHQKQDLLNNETLCLQDVPQTRL